MTKPALKIIAFDMDGTLTEERSSWEYLHRRLGIWDKQADQYQDQFLQGEISYEEFCRLDAIMWKNMSIEHVKSILNEIKIYPTALDLVHTSATLGGKTVLLSTGLKLLADMIAPHFNFWFYQANELVSRNGILTGECEVHVSTDAPGKTKGAYLENLMYRFGASQQETVAVGDSAGDLEMLSKAGLPIAVNPRQKDLEILSNAIPNLITVQNLKEVISILESKFTRPQTGFNEMHLINQGWSQR
ncbi:HAD family hydrolase [Desulfotruncus alcoholivorax]|uniref:HAD family hydrolase n=1 Tax=Desulfotruncus alcoholivorax TaxID=265477 RepID=UPI00040B81A8|nr:HAD-IB family phosphatase [Desulfotruncus alcoholivorax]